MKGLSALILRWFVKGRSSREGRLSGDELLDGKTGGGLFLSPGKGKSPRA